MPIVGGVDIHRKQLTFDYVEQETGRWERGRVAPADRQHLADWLARFDGVEDVQFAMEGCTGWRYVAEEMRAAGIMPHLAEPAETSTLRGRKRRAKTDRADAKLLRELLATGRLPSCYIPPSPVLEWRALLELYHDLRSEHSGWGAAHPCGLLPPGHHSAGAGRGDPRRPPTAAEDRRGPVVAGGPATGQHRLGRDADPGRTPRPAPQTAAGHRPARTRRPRTHARDLRRRWDDLPGPVRLAGRRRPVQFLPQGGPLRRPGHHRALLRQQAQPRPAVPPRPGGAALAAVRGRPRPPPAAAPPATATTRRSRNASTPTGPACPRHGASSAKRSTC